MENCKLQLRPEKNKIVNLRGFSEKKYPKGFNFLGCTIRPSLFKSKDKVKTIPSIFISKKSKNSIIEKFKTLKIHKKRKTIEQVSKAINPVIRAIINYYHKFRKSDMVNVWRQLNERLLKWVKWEKDLYKKASVRYLKKNTKKNPIYSHIGHWNIRKY